MRHGLGGTRHFRTADVSSELVAVIAVGATLLVGLGGLIISIQSRTGNRFVSSSPHFPAEAGRAPPDLRIDR